MVKPIRTGASSGDTASWARAGPAAAASIASATSGVPERRAHAADKRADEPAVALRNRGRVAQALRQLLDVLVERPCDDQHAAVLRQQVAEVHGAALSVGEVVGRIV